VRITLCSHLNFRILKIVETSFGIYLFIQKTFVLTSDAKVITVLLGHNIFCKIISKFKFIISSYKYITEHNYISNFNFFKFPKIYFYFLQN
jgi:hypothetical protein